MKTKYAKLICILAPLLLTACTSATTLTSPQEGVTIQLRQNSYTALPASDRIRTTTFGNYEFKAAQSNTEPLYGVLPLKFNGGFLALDILFFAPAMFFNLRGVQPQYEFDMTQRVVRYRSPKSSGWVEYQPTQAETDRAKRYFGDLP